MTKIKIEVERHAEAYEEAIDSILSAIRDWEYPLPCDVELLKELQAAIRIAGI